MKRKHKISLILFTVLLVLIIPTFSQVFHKNKGVSKSIGTVSNGKLMNAYKIPFKGVNFKYFSLFDYYILGRCYLNSSLHASIIGSYEELNNFYPDYTFRTMECSKKKGGRPFPHRTHQNGTSVDFMTPLKKNGKTLSFYDKIGMWRYLLKFNANGELTMNKAVEIDFDKMAKHIIVLEKHARKYGFRIKKVILETNLKDEIFQSKFGAELLKTNIYFVKSLPKNINELHDDHYHIDFERI